MNFGGAERDRTAGLLVANEALSQLSYSPNTFSFYQQSAKVPKCGLWIALASDKALDYSAEDSLTGKRPLHGAASFR